MKYKYFATIEMLYNILEVWYNIYYYNKIIKQLELKNRFATHDIFPSL